MLCPQNIYNSNALATRNSADVAGGKLAVLKQSVSSVNAINPLASFYEIRERKR
jgi:hypothetical protein